MAEPATTRPDPQHPWSDADTGSLGPGDWIALGIFVAVLLGCWIAQYQPFLLPNNDYASFERVARSFAAGELPASFKRMPVLPALMAGLAPVFEAAGRPKPYLDAALFWNQAFSFGALALALVLARRTFVAGALLLPLAIGTNVQFHLMGLQPLVEPSLVFFTLLAFTLHERGSAWQYAAAGLVALSRYEAGILIPALFLSNVIFEGRFQRHLVLSALACGGVAVWLGLSLVAGSGSGGGFYFQLMEGMGWQPAPGFLERSFKEPFRGWFVRSRWMVLPMLLAIAVPGVVGVWLGWRRFPRVTVALALAWLLGVGVIVGFGINKARYVAHTQWIPLFFWTAGVGWLAREGARRAAALTPGVGFAAALAAAGLAVLAAARGALSLAEVPAVVAPGAEFVLLWVAVVVLAAALAGRPGRPGATARLTAALVVTALAAPLFAGGLRAKDRGLHKVYYANYSAALLAPWLKENLADDRAVLLPRTHIDYLVGIGSPQLVLYSGFEVETAEELAAEMRRQGVRYAVYTFRREPDDPSERFYYRLHNMRVVDFFQSGGPVPGFRHVASLPLPSELERLPVQIYELDPPLEEASARHEERGKAQVAGGGGGGYPPPDVAEGRAAPEAFDPDAASAR